MTLYIVLWQTVCHYMVRRGSRSHHRGEFKSLCPCHQENLEISGFRGFPLFRLFSFFWFGHSCRSLMRTRIAVLSLKGCRRMPAERIPKIARALLTPMRFFAILNILPGVSGCVSRKPILRKKGLRSSARPSFLFCKTLSGRND